MYMYMCVCPMWLNHAWVIFFPFPRQRRMAEIAAAQAKAKFGSVKEISAVDYVDEVNKAGEGVWVVLHLYKTGYLSKLCVS